MPPRTPHPTTFQVPGLDDHLDSLRRGTREQFESLWVQIPAGGTRNMYHSLGEIPWVVDVVKSPTADGKSPVEANGDVTVAKDDRTIQVTNNLAAASYFQVRAH